MAPGLPLHALSALLLLAAASGTAGEEVPLVLDWASCKSVLRPCESKYNALVGDKMKLEFARAAHTVVLCDEAGYESCGLEGVCTEVDDGGRGAYILEVPESSRGGKLHVVCGQFDYTHCRAGQRMAITVAAEGTSVKEYPADFSVLPELPPPPLTLEDNEDIDESVGQGFQAVPPGEPPAPVDGEGSQPPAAPPPPVNAAGRLGVGGRAWGVLAKGGVLATAAAAVAASVVLLGGV